MKKLVSIRSEQGCTHIFKCVDLFKLLPRLNNELFVLEMQKKMGFTGFVLET